MNAGSARRAPGRRTSEPVTDGDQPAIVEFYACFNERRVMDAAAMFVDDAVVEQAPLRPRRGGAGYLEFAEVWLRAFPDAVVSVERIFAGADGLYDVELVAHGTHLGVLDLGSGGVFHGSGVAASLRLKQLLRFERRRIAYSSLSFELQDIVSQLVTVDAARLVEHTSRIRQLAETLAAADSLIDRQSALYQLGLELDEARQVARPHYRR